MKHKCPKSNHYSKDIANSYSEIGYMDAARSIYVQNPTIAAKTLLILIVKMDIMQQNLKK